MDTLELEEEKKRVLAAVKNDGRELEYASEELKKRQRSCIRSC